MPKEDMIKLVEALATLEFEITSFEWKESEYGSMEVVNLQLYRKRVKEK